MFTADKILIAINFLKWQNLPSKIALKGINRGFYFAYFYDQPLGGSRFSLALGTSLNSNNIFSNSIPKFLVDSSSNSNYTDFVGLDKLFNKPYSYVNNKMAFTYISIPFEVRLRPGKNEQWRIAAGFDAGFLLSSYVKYNGDNVFQNKNEYIKFKFFGIPNTLKFRSGVSFRMGYDRFTLRFYYPLTTVFQKDKGPQIFPIEIGLSLMVF